jgi:hypothetical protein
MALEKNTSEINHHSDEIPTLLSIRQFADKHKFMSESSLRWLLFRNPPGLEDCIVRTSANRLYLDEKKFFIFLRHMQTSKTLVESSS